MTTRPSRPTPPAPTCPTDQVGLCASCHHPTHRYGHGGNPLCVLCREEIQGAQKPRATAAA